MPHKKFTVAEDGPRIEKFLKHVFSLAGFKLDFTVAEGETPHPDFENPDLMIRFTGADVDLLLENKTELHEVYARLNKAGGTVIEQGETACCYAKSEKSWIDDPAGISWETFHTTGENTDYGDGSGEPVARIAHEKACCVPQAAPTNACGCASTE